MSWTPIDGQWPCADARRAHTEHPSLARRTPSSRASPSSGPSSMVEPRHRSPRLARMDDLIARRRLGALALTLIASMALAACSAGAGASVAPSGAPTAPSSVEPGASAQAPAASDGDGGAVQPDGAKVVVPRPGAAVDVQPI